MNPIRGNVDTRLRKLFEGACDALILAEAGLRRLGLTEHVTEILPPTTMMPAVGQGALGLETRSRRRVHPAGPCAAGRPRVPRRRGRRTVVDGVDRRWLLGAARRLGPRRQPATGFGRCRSQPEWPTAACCNRLWRMQRGPGAGRARRKSTVGSGRGKIDPSGAKSISAYPRTGGDWLILRCPREQNVPVPLSSAGSRIGSKCRSKHC